MEFYDVHFSYIDNETMEEEFVSVPEQGSGSLIPEGLSKAGHVYTIGLGDSGMIGVYKLEVEVVGGTGKFEKTGLGYDREAKESIETAFRFFKANSRNISASISTTNKDYLMHIQDVNGIGMTSELSLAAIIAMCSGALVKQVQSQLAVLGSVSIGGTINKVEDLANTLQVCFDAGAKKILLPMANAADIATVPPELLLSFK
ncbi:S16 family serine protease [Clostridium septicum]|uniref:S16 family serine protease n=1 Tax=Clostridium septicum TaxID=1504 RepID=UPI001FAB24F7|nr:S16 family serine protease [Clostridium septicum]